MIILDKENNLLLIIEFKACYSFDLIKKNKSEEYIEAVRRDMGKSQKKYPDIPMYSILFVTHPLTSIGNRFPGIIKYRNGINKYLMFNKETEIIKNAVLKLKSSFSGVQFRSIIENDFALEQSVSLFYGLIKKQ